MAASPGRVGNTMGTSVRDHDVLPRLADQRGHLLGRCPVGLVQDVVYRA